ncbi:MAG: hypothetical protein ACLFOY_01200 [Desulfatibacillaceae bacterium]
MNRRKTVVFALIAVFAALAAVEIAARVYMRAADMPRHRERRVGNPYHPYLGWEHAAGMVMRTANPCGGKSSVIRTNEKGYSITPLAPDDPELVVVMTGGSATMGIGATDNAHTVPSVLERLLAGEFGVAAEVVNLGTRGYQSFQEMLALRRYFLESGADLVLALSGRNDAYFGAIFPEPRAVTFPDRIYGIAERVRAMERGAGCMDPLPWLRKWSAAVDLAAAAARQGPAMDRVFNWRIDSRGDMSTMNVPMRVDAMGEHFAMAASLCRENGAGFVFMLQPTAFSRKQLTPGEASCLDLNSPKTRYLARYERSFYHAFRRRETAFSAVDLSGVFDDVAVDAFVDVCHYSDRGAEILAREILEEIRPTVEAILAPPDPGP